MNFSVTLLQRKFLSGKPIDHTLSTMADPATLLAAEQVISTTVQGGAVAAYGTSPTQLCLRVLLDVISVHLLRAVMLIY